MVAEKWYVSKCQQPTKHVHKQKGSLPAMADVLVVNEQSNLSLIVGILIFRKPLH
jgi:hypothetical protein